MTIQDLINAVFEGVGSIMIWLNVYRIYKDKGYAGMSIATVMFMTIWGFYNLYYYPHLQQWVSFFAGLSMSLANCFWLSLMLYFGFQQNEETQLPKLHSDKVGKKVQP